MMTEEKLQIIKSKDLPEDDKQTIYGWESALREIQIGTDFLQLEMTQRLIRGILEDIGRIDEYLRGLEVVDETELIKLNNLLAQKKVKRELLAMFRYQEDLKGRKEQLENEINESFTNLNML